ncbi:MAG TPA: PLDc N-terminal domain-containing protein [Actinomycetota bacterium]|nr:PLDc N-terminal domain-containing protein [Actinomycetota bacterium]
MLMFRLGGLLLVALSAYCVFDVIRSPDPAVRELPKLVWLLLVLLFPPIGPIAWLLLGRPENASFSDPNLPRAHPSAPPMRAPDTDPDFLRSVDAEVYELRRQEALRRWEEEKRRRKELEGDDPPELEGGPGA